MRTGSLDSFPEPEKQEVARLFAKWKYHHKDFNIKSDGEDVLVFYVPTRKGKRYRAEDRVNWITPFEADLVEQYFRMSAPP